MLNFFLSNRAKNLFIKAFFISLVTLLFTDYMMQFDASVTGNPAPSWGLLGRWINMILHGQFSTDSIAAMPAVKLEDVRGFSVHVVIGFVFSLFYLCFVNQNLKWQKQLAFGLGFGVLLILFPLCLELPSMGAGFFALDTPAPLFTVLRVLTVHFSFGLGLGVGTILLRQLSFPR